MEPSATRSRTTSAWIDGHSLRHAHGGGDRPPTAAQVPHLSWRRLPLLPRPHPQARLRRPLLAACRRLLPDYWVEICHRFVTGSRLGAHAPSTESFSGADLSFLPGPSAREKDYLRHVGARHDAQSEIILVHSAAGLLLCSRGRIHPMHFYVCNPVTWQWVALPELPWPSHQWHSGLLTVGTRGDGAVERFNVVLFNHPMHWRKEDGCLDLMLFSSDTGWWETMQLQPPVSTIDYCSIPIHGQSGTVY
ncbi:hypothetical protein ACP70R_037698 [Stipagrostis hirtigluma subsp. patula]